jgi:hypothetical protein
MVHTHNTMTVLGCVPYLIEIINFYLDANLKKKSYANVLICSLQKISEKASMFTEKW